MAQIQDGVNGTIIASVGAEQLALRVASRPIDTGTRGHYRLSVNTGTIAAALAANSQLFQFRWTDATRLAVITRLRVRFLPLTPFTAATLTDHTSVNAFIARSFTGGGGGTTVSLATNANKMRTSMQTSLAAVSVASTGTLTAVTGLDANPFCQSIRKGNRVNPAAATEEVIQPETDGMFYDCNPGDGEHPIVLVQNEAVAVANRTVWPAAGTGIYTFEIVWAEVTSY